MNFAQTELITKGRWLKTLRLRNEWYDFVTQPEQFVRELKESKPRADLFTFLGEIPDRDTAKYPFFHEWETIAVLPITTYEHWWKNQINDKTRNMARKPGKKGVEIRLVEFSDDLVRGIMGINNDCPMRQGRPFWHYGADFETTKRVNISYLETSQFVGAYLGDELIGYIKLVFGDRKASLMQILAKISQRDKAPTNGLMAKAVEICAARNIPHLHYALFSRRGLGEFKMNHAMEPWRVARYFLPLNAKGSIALKLNLQHKWSDYLPGEWVDKLVDLRVKWYGNRVKDKAPPE